MEPKEPADMYDPDDHSDWKEQIAKREQFKAENAEEIAEAQADAIIQEHGL